MYVSLCYHASALMLACVCPHTKMRLSLCFRVCVLMLATVCPYDIINMHLCQLACVLTLRCVCPYVAQRLKNIIYGDIVYVKDGVRCSVTKFREGDEVSDEEEKEEEGDAKHRIEVGRKVQKSVNQRIHKKACLLLFDHYSLNVSLLS